jgi:Putative adhesin
MTGPPPMTRARLTILAVGVPVALAVIGLCTGAWVHGAVNTLANLQQVGRSVTFTAPAGPNGVHLILNDGNITFHTATSDTGVGSPIQVHGRLSGGMVAPTFSHRLTASGLTLDPQCRSPIGGCSIGLHVTGPAGMPVNIDDSFGQLDTSGLNGNVTLSSNSGNISASRLRGTLRLSDSFGDIDASILSGLIKLTSNSGDIDASQLTGDTQIFDSFGSVTVNGVAAADVKCTGQSADFTVVFTKVPRDVQVSDSFGNVTLVLPAGLTRYHVITRNKFGSTSVKVPQSSTAADTITVISNSGDIVVKTGPAVNP